MIIQHLRVARDVRLLGIQDRGWEVGSTEVVEQPASIEMGHNTGQSQRSNLLEFHSEFFLLMVYKR